MLVPCECPGSVVIHVCLLSSQDYIEMENMCVSWHDAEVQGFLVLGIWSPPHQQRAIEPHLKGRPLSP